MTSLMSKYEDIRLLKAPILEYNSENIKAIKQQYDELGFVILKYSYSVFDSGSILNVL
jgi:hypothetical protein